MKYIDLSTIFYYGGKIWGVELKKEPKGRFDHTLGLWIQGQKQTTKVKIGPLNPYSKGLTVRALLVPESLESDRLPVEIQRLR